MTRLVFFHRPRSQRAAAPPTASLTAPLTPVQQVCPSPAEGGWGPQRPRERGQEETRPQLGVGCFLPRNARNN